MREFSARDQLVIAHFLKTPAWLSSDLKDCQLGSARKNPARLGSAQLAKFQLECITSMYKHMNLIFNKVLTPAIIRILIKS